jgi:hypothetical protein
MNDVLDRERIKRFRTIRNDLLRRRDALQLKLNQMRIERVKAEQDLRDLDMEIGVATRHLRHAEIPLSEYIAEIIPADDEGRGYYAQVVARANALKNADMIQQTGAPARQHPEPKSGEPHATSNPTMLQQEARAGASGRPAKADGVLLSPA